MARKRRVYHFAQGLRCAPQKRGALCMVLHSNTLANASNAQAMAYLSPMSRARAEALRQEGTRFTRLSLVADREPKGDK